MSQSSRRPKRENRARRVRLAPSRLEAMIEEAIIDAYTESEQAGGFHVMIEQELDLPFETTVLGVTVSVKRVDITDASDVVAICYRGRERQAIPILETPVARPTAGRVGVDRGVPSVGARALVTETPTR